VILVTSRHHTVTIKSPNNFASKFKKIIIMENITFETLPKAVQTISEQLQVLSEKFDKVKLVPAQDPDENRYVNIDEIRQTIFPLWKKQTIYNKVCLGELPHSRIGSRLLFHLKECREWRDRQLQQGKIKSQTQIDDEDKALFEKHQKKSNS
jgi:hypothetical protein